MIVVGLIMAVIVVVGVAAGLLLLVGSFFIFPPAPFLIVGWLCYSIRKYRWVERFWQAAERAKHRPEKPVVRRDSSTTKRRPSIFGGPITRVTGSDDWNDEEEDSPPTE